MIHIASKRLTTVFENDMAKCFVYATVVLSQLTGMSKEVCLYAGADWLSSSVSHRVVTGQFLYKAANILLKKEKKKKTTCFC